MELLVIILLVLLVIIISKYINLSKQVNTFSEYIDHAIEDTLELSDFDEKELSKIKSKLFKFLHANQVRASKLNKEKNKTKDLIADISHQTKTPIANLSLYIALLENNPEKAYIEIIKHELDKLNFLIDNLVKSSRLESNIIVLQKSEADLSALVHDVLKEFNKPLTNKNIKITYIGEKCIFKLDERWLREAVHNLIDNAIKYSPDNSNTNISVYQSYLNYRVAIDNEYQNLSEEDLPNLYKRFYRGKNSVSKDGLGLGLNISRDIIEKHGGHFIDFFKQ